MSNAHAGALLELRAEYVHVAQELLAACGVQTLNLVEVQRLLLAWADYTRVRLDY